MEKVDPDDLENRARAGTITKHLSDPLALSDMALNYYELAPGDGFSDGLHTHMNQEEVFYVIEGTATFETVDGEHTVEAGEAIRFAPGEYQTGRNEGDERIRALAFGAPQEMGEGRIKRACEACGDADYHFVTGMEDGQFVLECPECGNETTR